MVGEIILGGIFFVLIIIVLSAYASGKEHNDGSPDHQTTATGRNVLKNNINPIDAITINGTMGFLIGDSRAFVKSRIKHLNLASKEELEDLEEIGYNSMITVAHDLFGHIKDVSFSFNDDKLNEITILFDKRPEEIAEFFEIVEWRLAAKIGKPTYKGKGIVKWGHNISLFDNLEQDDKRALFLFIKDYI